MTLITRHIKRSLTKLDLITISFVIACCGVLIYPHKADAGGALLAGKTVIEVLMFASFTLFATSKLSSNDVIFERSPLSMPLTGLTLLIVITSFFAQNRPIAIEAISLYLAYITCFYVFLSFLRQKNQQISLVYLLLCLTLVLCFWGLTQNYLINLKYDMVWRLHSTFGNSNQMAGFLSMTIPLFVGVMFTREFSKPKFFLLCLMLVTMTITLFLTYARGGWIATAIGIIFILCAQTITKRYRPKKVAAIAFSLFFLLTVLFISSIDLVKRFNTMTQQETEVTMNGRLQAWQGTITMIREYPVTGVGPGNYGKAFRRFQQPGFQSTFMRAHNDYLQFISETGILLIPIMIWLIFNLFHHGFTKIRHADRHIRGITLGAMGGIVAILVYSVSDFNLNIPANALLFTVLAALVASKPFAVSSQLKPNN